MVLDGMLEVDPRMITSNGDAHGYKVPGVQRLRCPKIPAMSGSNRWIVDTEDIPWITPHNPIALFTLPVCLIDPFVPTSFLDHQLPTEIERSPPLNTTCFYPHRYGRPTLRDRGISVAGSGPTLCGRGGRHTGIVHNTLTTFDNRRCQASPGQIIHTINSPYHINTFF